MSYIGSSARPGDLYDEDTNECTRCHKSMLTDDGCDPTDLCHNCAHERVDELETQVQQLREALQAILSRVALVSPYYEMTRAALDATDTQTVCSPLK